MAIIKSKGLIPLRFNNETGIIPEGFSSASLKVSGTGSATLTQDGESWILSAGDVFNFDNRDDNNPWIEVEVDATNTVVDCVYQK